MRPMTTEQDSYHSAPLCRPRIHDKFPLKECCIFAFDSVIYSENTWWEWIPMAK